MSSFLFGVGLQWKMDLRNKGILLTYYAVPLLFFAFMGGIFSSINPASKDTLIQSMNVFGITMGAILGASSPLVEVYGSEIKKAYQMGKIPIWVAAVNNFISAFLHLFLMSLIIFILAPLAFEAKTPSNLGLYFLAISIFIMASITTGTVLGLFIKNTSRLTMVAQVIFLPSIMLSGIMFPVTMLPGAMEMVGLLFPATWGFKMMINEVFDIKQLMPLIAIIIITVGISIFKLSILEKTEL